MKRGDHRRRRTVGRIKCGGGGNGGDPVGVHHVGPYVRQFTNSVSARARSVNAGADNQNWKKSAITKPEDLPVYKPSQK